MSASPTFAIFGATGAQGFPVVLQALRSGLQVRTIGRDAHSLQAIAQRTNNIAPGALSCAIADFDSMPSLERALTGVVAAFAHLPIAKSAEQPGRFLGNLLAAAAAVELPLLVFSTSGPASDRYRSSPLIEGNRAATRAVLAGATPAIVVQPTFYLENLAVDLFVPRLAAEGVLDYPPTSGDRRVWWTSQHDQAVLAVAAMQKPHLAGRAYEIASAQPLNSQQVAQALSAAQARAVRFESINPGTFGARVAKALHNPPLADLLADMYDAVFTVKPNDDHIDVASLERLFEVKLGSVRERIALLQGNAEADVGRRR